MRRWSSFFVVAATLAVASPSIAGDKETCATAAEQAQRLRGHKKLRAARDEILVCSRDVCPRFIRSDCVKWLTELDAALPTVIVRVRDPQGKDVVNVKVTVDGASFAALLDGTAQAVDPGPHTFRYEAAGMDPVEENVLVSQNEKDRVLRVVLSPKGGAKPVTENPVTENPVTTEPKPNASNDHPETSASASPSPAPWVIGGIGAAGLVTFGIFETLAQVGYGDMKNGCGATAQKCAPGDVDTLHAEFAVALVGLIVGVVGLGTAATMLLLRPSASKPTAGFVLAPVGGGMYGGIRASF